MVNATRFRTAHQADWDKLDAIVARIEKGGVSAVSEESLLVLPLLYRSALSSLSVARETSLDRSLIVYLEQLCTRAYFQIYGVPTSARRQLGRFFAHSWPMAVQSLWRETLVALVLTVVGAVVAYVLIRNDPAWFYAVIPDALAQGRDPTASVALLRDTIYGSSKMPGNGESALATFAASLFTHNAQISIFAFALGFAFAVPTALLLAYNGLMMGAMLAVFVPKGLGFGFVGWLMIHGTTEIFAIVIAGAAGFRIGMAIAFPGRAARTDAAVAAGRSAATAMGGAVVMLAVAGLLEGIGRQTITSDVPRYAIGLAMLAGWCVYFYLPRKTDGAAA
ncbi:stage II sporulation protein M [uncultured Sphingomonas sp.]|uniref:stage II sporulation protein M n=1 Tax=uncultured Sphingomonas sp. TaxID=158754 RepID=UPI0035CB2FA4